MIDKDTHQIRNSSYSIFTLKYVVENYLIFTWPFFLFFFFFLWRKRLIRHFTLQENERQKCSEKKLKLIHVGRMETTRISY